MQRPHRGRLAPELDDAVRERPPRPRGSMVATVTASSAIAASAAARSGTTSPSRGGGPPPTCTRWNGSTGRCCGARVHDQGQHGVPRSGPSDALALVAVAQGRGVAVVTVGDQERVRRSRPSQHRRLRRDRPHPVAHALLVEHRQPSGAADASSRRASRPAAGPDRAVDRRQVGARWRAAGPRPILHGARHHRARAGAPRPPQSSRSIAQINPRTVSAPPGYVVPGTAGRRRTPPSRRRSTPARAAPKHAPLFPVREEPRRRARSGCPGRRGSLVRLRRRSRCTMLNGLASEVLERDLRR